MSYWVYIARCGDTTLYTGATTDLERRIREHNEKRHGAKYTAGRLPICLAQAWEVKEWSDALRLEKALKKMSRNYKEKLIKEPAQIYELANSRDWQFSISCTQTGAK